MSLKIMGGAVTRIEIFYLDLRLRLVILVGSKNCGKSCLLIVSGKNIRIFVT